MFKQYREIQYGEFLVCGADCSAGGKDYSAACFISKNHNDVPLIWHSRNIASNMTDNLVPIFNRVYDKTGIEPLVAYERNNGGTFELERVAAMNRAGKYELFRMPTIGDLADKDTIKYGWDTNTGTRSGMLEDLKVVIDNKILRVYDRQTIREMLSFVCVQTSNSWKAQAERNAHDDLIMALAIAWQLILRSPSIQVKSPDKNKATRQEFRHRHEGY